MKTTIKTLALGLSALTLFAGAAQAQPANGRPNMDANGDGVVTRAESQQAAIAMFARLDVNKDGKLDKSDRDERRGEMREKSFDRLDADDNGAISRDEFMAPPPRDGERPAGAGRMGGKPGMRGHRGGMMMMRMADTNKDGAVSQAEFVAAADKRFDMMDTNHDGKVTQEERDAARQAMRQKWKAAKPDAQSAGQ